MAAPAGTLPAFLAQSSNMRNIDLKNNRFSALEAPYVTGAGMNTTASLLNNFRVSFNQINVRLRSLGRSMGVHFQRCCCLLYLVCWLAWGTTGRSKW